MIKRPHINYAVAGTQEQWSKYSKYCGVSHVIPADIYVNKHGIFLITSQEWCDWLHGKTDRIPEVENYEQE